MAARLGLPVMCLGEVGYDAFGEAVLEGLQAEGIDCGHIVVSPAVRTPVAGVIVDRGGEPAYLGYRGELRIGSLPQPWLGRSWCVCALRRRLGRKWGIASLVLEAFQRRRVLAFRPSSIPARQSRSGQRLAQRVVQLSQVVLANEKEAVGLTGAADADCRAGTYRQRGEAGRRQAGRGGLPARDQGPVRDCSGYPVPVVDATGAGDSLAAGSSSGISTACRWPVSACWRMPSARRRYRSAAPVERAYAGRVQAVLHRFSEDSEILNAKRSC
jgi:sugar/nucleoside kinase (ribokinase family)